MTIPTTCQRESWYSWKFLVSFWPVHRSWFLFLLLLLLRPVGILACDPCEVIKFAVITEENPEFFHAFTFGICN